MHTPAPARQTAPRVLLVTPRAFEPNPQTAASNAFQRRSGGPAAQARAECVAAAEALDAAGVQCLVFDDTPEPPKPDAVFPNNWLSTDADGRVILYPLAAPNRRPERRTDIVAALARDHGLAVRAVHDLSGLERQDQFLEGTGSLVLDRVARVAYVAWSPRSHPAALAAFLALTGYSGFAFHTRGPGGEPVYHTNVLLSLGREFAVVCLDAVLPEDRPALERQLEAGGRELLLITPEQMAGFAGNLLELDGTAGPVIALSATALAGLSPAQRGRLERHGRLLPLRVPAIEAGGGSVRCMLAEIFLPPAGLESRA